MGSITRGLSNNITTGGVILPAGITNASVSAVTSFSGVTGGGTLTLISTQTASSSASISFTSGLDSTYDVYEFKFINVRPTGGTAQKFTFNFSTDSGSNYNVTKTTTSFYAYHNESGADSLLTYTTGNDLAQSTSFNPLTDPIGTGSSTVNSDDSASGYMQLFNPSSTTYVKHFISAMNQVNPATYAVVNYHAGYGNTTSAINAIRFQMASGNFDGEIKMYGVKKS
jgi:hypothetical protein